ncbi:MAG: gamma carbonic anhydrase family protein [Candidatus Rokubacteria bacterium]|nr:gamma carbonic anhydrase family protein [Candidatus Rokubacteria bacterium]
MPKGTASEAAGGAVFAFGRHRPRIHPTAFITPGTYIVGRVTIKARASVWFGAVLRGDFGRIEIGEGSLIEDNVVLHGDVVVGKHCVVGHGAILHGCSLGDRAVIGANAVVFDGAVVGAGALVAAGSVVYPRTRVARRTVFRNSTGGNPPSIAAVGDRLRHWRAESYTPIISAYRRGWNVRQGVIPRSPRSRADR